MTISALPPAPSRSDAPADFVAKADAFLAALDLFRTEVNATAAAFDVTMWVTGTTYAIGDRVWSPANYQTYRRKTNGAGATDPSADTTNWSALQEPFTDSNPVVVGSSDATKKIAFEADGITTGTTRTYTGPNKNGTLSLTSDATRPGLATNVGGAVTLGSSALTFAIKDAAGADPSASSPVELCFQSATATTGTTTKRTVSAADSITIASTALGGTVSAKASRIYFGYLDNAGTPELCWWNPVIRDASGNVTGLFAIDHGALYSTTANGAGSDSAGVIYSASARSNVRVIPIAYVDSVQTTAGTWAQAIDKLTIIGPDTPTTGDELQAKGARVTEATFSTASTSYTDLTGMSVSITPSSKSNIIELATSICASGGTNTSMFFQFVRGSTAILVGDAASSRPVCSTLISMENLAQAPNFMKHCSALGFDAPDSVSATTYKIQTSVNGGTGYLNRSVTDTDSSLYPRGASVLLAKEICA